jgi:hypothetical protein
MTRHSGLAGFIELVIRPKDIKALGLKRLALSDSKRLWNLG